jgi:hypothetical protein
MKIQVNLKAQERCVTHKRVNTKQKKEHCTEYRKGEYQTWRKKKLQFTGIEHVLTGIFRNA